MSTTPHPPPHPFNANTLYLPSTIERVLQSDADFYQDHLKGFVAPGVFDVHAHLYTVQGLRLPFPEDCQETECELGYAFYHQTMAAWMGDDAPTDGLFFAAPLSREVDIEGENQFVVKQLRDRPDSQALMLIRPNDDADVIESMVKKHGYVGFKVYHLLADVPPETPTLNLPNDRFIPEWAWEISNRLGLSIMLHMVRSRALADPINQTYISEHCRRYPHAKLILAHAARGFCARHTAEGIDSLRGLDNVFFDTSAICEPGAFESILRVFGSSRLMFGTDWPICNIRGRCVSVGDGFFWMMEHNVDFASESFATPTIIGNESLLALRDAATSLQLTTNDLENIFFRNAHQLVLNISAIR